MIPYSTQTITWIDALYVAFTVKCKNLTQGSEITRFENSVASYVGAKYAVAVSSATAGLHLSHLALNLPAGSIVGTSPLSFVASANSALYAGLVPVFIDIDINTGNISVNSFKKELQQHKIKTLVPVHYAGGPCEMEELHEICIKNDIKIIEDAAHALGSIYRSGEKVGSCKYSDLTVFSFHPVKTITSGEGGVITTNNKDLYEKLLKLRSHGIVKDIDKIKNNTFGFTAGVINPWYYEMDTLGYNYRITDFQAALGYSQMKKIGKFLSKRSKLAKRYDKAFNGNKFFQPTQLDFRKLSANHLYPIKIDFTKVKISRNEIMNELRSRGIVTQVHYLPIPLHNYYQKLGYSLENLPNTMNLYCQLLSIPLFPKLKLAKQNKVIKELQNLINDDNE